MISAWTYKNLGHFRQNEINKARWRVGVGEIAGRVG